MLAILLCTLSVTACSGSNNGKKEGDSATKAPAPAATDAPKSSPDAPKDKTKVNFYGKIVEYSSGEPMVVKMQELLPNLDINASQVDWGNLLTVLKTGIAAGSPPDVAVYWPMQMKPFVDAEQALDLTPYLEENSGEWKNSFEQAYLDQGKYNGKYYALPIDANYSMMMANADLFTKAGIQVPEGSWSWEEFVAACKELKEKAGVSPFSVSTDLNPWLIRNGMLSLAADDNKVDDLANGKIEATSDYFKIPLQKTKELYDAKYWYPGEGALTLSRDESKAAFMQGKVAILGEVSALFASIQKDAGFKVVPVEWPHMGKTSLFNGGTDGIFIPVNTANPEEAIQMLKTFTGPEVQQIHADAGFITVNTAVKSTDPSVQAMAVFGKNSSSHEFFNYSAKVTDYMAKEALADYVLNGSGDKVLQKLEQLRVEAVNP